MRHDLKKKVINDFGNEWKVYNQERLNYLELKVLGFFTLEFRVLGWLFFSI